MCAEGKQCRGERLVKEIGIGEPPDGLREFTAQRGLAGQELVFKWKSSEYELFSVWQARSPCSVLWFGIKV